MRLSRCAGSPEPSLYSCMISTSISIAGTNTVVILQRWFRTFKLKILLYLINFRSRRLNTIAATSPFEQKNRKTTRSNAHESIEMVGVFFLFIWYSDVQYASIFILWWNQKEFKVALVVTDTYCELLTCISVVVSVVGGVIATKNALSLEVPPPIRNVY